MVLLYPFVWPPWNVAKNSKRQTRNGIAIGTRLPSRKLSLTLSERTRAMGELKPQSRKGNAASGGNRCPFLPLVAYPTPHPQLAFLTVNSPSLYADWNRVPAEK